MSRGGKLAPEVNRYVACHQHGIMISCQKKAWDAAANLCCGQCSFRQELEVRKSRAFNLSWRTYEVPNG